MLVIVISAGPRIAIPDLDLQQAIANGKLFPPYRAQRLRFPGLLARALEGAASLAGAQPGLRCAYSVKTNPAPEVLRLVRSAGLSAEVISPEELAAAFECGFQASDVIYNGPLPAARCEQAPGVIFADSLEAFTGNRQCFPDARNGLRLRPRGIASRFGVPVERAHEIVQVLRSERVEAWHASFHVRPQDYGAHTWRSLVDGVIAAAAEIERDSGARVLTFDVGGGQRPEQFDAAIVRGDFRWLCGRVTSALPYARDIYCEPGQALVTAYEAVVAPVLEVRHLAEGRGEVVVAAGYPDLPQIHSFPHRLFVLRDGCVKALGQGGARIVGRTCLEYDIIAQDVDASACDASSAIVVADAGAYDASMRFPFAQGGSWE